MPVATILKNATDERLGLAVFENLYDLFRAMADTLPDSQLVEQEGFSRHLTFLPTRCSKVYGTLTFQNKARTRRLMGRLPGLRNKTHLTSFGGQAEIHLLLISSHG